MCDRLDRVEVAFLLTLCACLCGCTQRGQKGRILLTTHPEFYDSRYKRIAVIPFSTGQGVPSAAGERISAKIEARLSDSGEQQLYTRSRLKELMDEKDLVHAGVVAGDVVVRYGRVGGVDALVCGTVTRYALSEQREVTHSQYGSSVSVRYDAIVECDVRVVDTRDGRVVYLATASGTDDSSGFVGNILWHPRPADDVLQAAENALVERIMPRICVVRREVELPDDVLQVSTGRQRGEWARAFHVTPSNERLFAITRLPGDAGGANLTIAVIPRGKSAPAATRQFTWKHQQSEHVVEFDLRAIVQVAGFGAYTAELQTDDGTAAWCEFEIAALR